MDATANDSRRARGQALAQSKGKRFRHIVGSKYLVPSAQDGAAGYVVDVEAGQCSCPDHEERAVRCKHLWAVEFFRSEVTTPDGTTVVTEAVRLTCSQDWVAYHAAKDEEPDVMPVLLHSLCARVPEPKQGMGRPRIPARDAIYCSAMKVWAKDAHYDTGKMLREGAALGHIQRVPSLASRIRAMERADLTPILQDLVTVSAMPLRGVETVFAIDSTGFGTSTFARWFDEKHGKGTQCRRYVKLHAMVGTRTNVYTAVHVTESVGNGTGDCPNLVPLLHRAHAAGFQLDEVTADKAYLAHEVLAAIERFHGTPFIPFKSGSLPTGSPAWERMYIKFSADEAFWAHYHQRSNVEATFAATKKRCGGSVMSINPDAQYNEVLLKCIVYNLSRLIHFRHELGIEATFDAPRLPPKLLTAGSPA
jgi:transposase